MRVVDQLVEQTWMTLEAVAQSRPDLSFKSGVSLARETYEGVTWDSHDFGYQAVHEAEKGGADLWFLLEVLSRANPHQTILSGVILAKVVAAGIQSDFEGKSIIPAGVPTPSTSLDYSDSASFAAWIGRNLPEANNHIRSDRFVQAIKEVRARTFAGLADAKNACDILKEDKRLMRV